MKRRDDGLLELDAAERTLFGAFVRPDVPSILSAQELARWIEEARSAMTPATRPDHFIVLGLLTQLADEAGVSVLSGRC
ncbi:hypothetical protein [Rhodanobacter denitrificans]|uniref:hypothetical protein n=1 Tax=Rhodanobacter denitrificans TaxID=666685 RepID=UPI001F34D9BF|nr:hypothetical protein [Rhodanobacter denitrificans]UJJ60434.1 hypothetical protein LRK55_18515 [Rhodanobacter denitrificans]